MARRAQQPFFSLFILIAGTLFAAAPANAQLLDPADLTCGTITYGANDRQFSLCCNGNKPGITRERGDLVKFTAVSKKRRNARRRGRKSAVKRWRQILRAGKSFCDNPSSSGPILPPEDSPFKHWSIQGEVTSDGKTCFEIPATLSANVLAGENDWNEHCQGCHGDQTLQVNRKFPALRTIIADDPMYLLEEDVNDIALANITAYLNRFNPNDCPE